jgi:membrane-associated phospholipid phosphatase
MEGIEALDWGTYSFFDFQNQKNPAILPLMWTGYQASGYVGAGILLLVAVLLFLVQGKYRSALVSLLSSAFAVGLIEAVRWLVPRRRPDKAENWVGADGMLGSYPSAAVFLTMLALILIGFAVWGLTKRIWLRVAYIVVAALLTAWVCLSQMFLALHFLTDILGGLAGAALVGWIAYQFLDRPPATAATPAPASDAIQDLSHRHGIQM